MCTTHTCTNIAQAAVVSQSLQSVTPSAAWMLQTESEPQCQALVWVMRTLISHPHIMDELLVPDHADAVAASAALEAGAAAGSESDDER